MTDYDNHRVQVFDTLNGGFLRTIGLGLGSAPGEMNQPIVPCLDEETGFLYVADYSNNRVQIFDKDTGVFIRQIGGSRVGGTMTDFGSNAFHGPRGICIDNVSGLLFIADREVSEGERREESKSEEENHYYVKIDIIFFVIRQF